jgi:hypothetical protein
MHSTKPEDYLIGLKDIIGDKQTNPPKRGLIQVSRSTWLLGATQGRFPKPIKIGGRLLWSYNQIQDFIHQLSNPQK